MQFLLSVKGDFKESWKFIGADMYSIKQYTNLLIFLEEEKGNNDMQDKIKILFICHGNICRSPMAEFIMKKLVSDAGLAAYFQIASAATSTEEIWNGIGNPVYPLAKAELARHGISCEGKRARQVTRADYAEYDYLIGMDGANIRNMLRIFGGDPEGKVAKLLSYAGSERDISDPWYTGDFGTTYADVLEGCTAFLEYLQQNSKIDT